MNYSRIHLVPVFLCITAYCQTPTEKPSFEVASIRQSITDPMKGIMTRTSGGPGTKDPTRFTAENLSLSNLIIIAHEISYWQLSATEVDRAREMFNVTATVPEGTTKEQFSLMLQRLLEDRFGLKVHWDSKEMPLYELSVSKNGPKFKESKGEPGKESDSPPAPGPMKRDAEGYPQLVPGRSGMAMMNGRARWQAINEPMSRFASMLSGQMRGPVEDATGLTGKYDFALYWSTNRSAGRPAVQPASASGIEASEPDYSSGPTIFEALRDQLGLNVDKKKGPVKVLVVDHFEKLPTPN